MKVPCNLNQINQRIVLFTLILLFNPFLAFNFINTIDQNLQAADTNSSPSIAHFALEKLNWFIGRWQFNTEEEKFEMNVEWSPDGNYLLVHEIASSSDGNMIWSGKRIIAWNPISEIFETWVFRDDGSFGGGIMQQYGNQWSAPVKLIMANGNTTTAVNLYTPQSTGGFIWESTSRTLNGIPLPNLGPLNVPIQ